MSGASDPDALLTVPEVARLARVNPRTVRAAIERGELVAVRLGESDRGWLRVRRVDYRAWLEARSTRQPVQLMVEPAIVLREALQPRRLHADVGRLSP